LLCIFKFTGKKHIYLNCFILTNVIYTCKQAKINVSTVKKQQLAILEIEGLFILCYNIKKRKNKENY
jgi:hypothetical protein